MSTTDLFYQNPANANVVLEAIAEIFGADTATCRIGVAYVTRQGASLLVETLAPQIQDWAAVDKTIVTCFDFGHTQPEALEFLADEGFEVRIANLGAGGSIQLLGASSFHPKFYLAGAESSWKAVVGSANLSRRALTINAEAVMSVALPSDSVAAVWDELISTSVPLTAELLDAYRADRPTQRTIPPADEPDVPAPAEASELPVFRDEVEAGTVDPSKFQAFWVEIGGPSGGSGNQLELPRWGQRFFGFDFDDYDDEHHVIGHLTFTASGKSWDGRPVTWHGNNRMERVNLPTPAQSGLQYSHQVVLFQRKLDEFEITVASPDSERAMRWRDESAASETIYRFGPASDRRCGLV